MTKICGRRSSFYRLQAGDKRLDALVEDHRAGGAEEGHAGVVVDDRCLAGLDLHAAAVAEQRVEGEHGHRHQGQQHACGGSRAAAQLLEEVAELGHGPTVVVYLQASRHGV
ncbi:MAG: hypothetical protein IPI43_30035 [Sandaracinaceae bacterium]|nr:hypothetical protein [Sandaracinaceae bacterium]